MVVGMTEALGAAVDARHGDVRIGVGMLLVADQTVPRLGSELAGPFANDIHN